MHPARGVWVEIVRTIKNDIEELSLHPARGVWVEIAERSGLEGCILWDAWIETNIFVIIYY